MCHLPGEKVAPGCTVGRMQARICRVIVQEWFDNGMTKVLLTWPPSSPVPNPIWTKWCDPWRPHLTLNMT